MAEQKVEDGKLNPALGAPWRESLFGCFNDMRSCCCGFCCPSCLYGLNAEKVDGSNCAVQSILHCVLATCYLQWVPQCLKRKKLREKFRLQPDPCHDCLVSACCTQCGLCQEARELKSRAGPMGSVYPVRSEPPVAYRR